MFVLRDRDFYKKTLVLMLPVILQQLITVGINFRDNIRNFAGVRANSDCEDFIIAGPTCDSQDIMYEYFRNPLPAYIKPGDRIYWFSCGAYTASYASCEFNGFPPIKVYIVDSGKK